MTLDGFPWATVAHHADEFNISTIKSIDPAKDGTADFTVGSSDGWSLYVENKQGLPLPNVGESLVCFGRGMGYTVRGIGGSDHLYRYRTEAEEEVKHQKWVAEREAQQQADWNKGLLEFNAKVGAMPEVFRQRFAEFTSRCPQNWGPKFGGYEMFVCEQALLIADWAENAADDAGFLTTDIAIKAFYDADNETQDAVLGEENHGNHSGNTFGQACTLASVYLANPEHIPNMHGALCPMVGCDDYGCYASTPEAKAAKADAKAT